MPDYPLILLVLTVLGLVNPVYPQQGVPNVSVKPDKAILLPKDDSVQLTCSPQNIPDDPYNVTVFTSQNTVIYNSSDPNQRAANMKIVNQTSIILYKVQNGISDVNCRINNTFSKISTTIPHINSVTLSHSDFRANDSTTIKCGISISPNVTDLTTSLYVNGTEVGRYATVQFQVTIFSMPTVLPNLRVEQGNETYAFTVIPGPDFVSGKFTCSVQVRVSTDSATVVSNEWDTSGSGNRTLAISTFLLITLIFSLHSSNFW